MNLIADLLFFAAALALGYAAMLAAARLPFFPLRELVVAGPLQEVTPTQVEYAAGSAVAGNFFTVNLDAVRAAFEKLPWVRKAEVRRRWPNGLELAIEEHVAAARWKHADAPKEAPLGGTLQEHGCFIGSAAIIVLSQHDSARAAALNAMRFFAHESCGKCTPCRVGTQKAAELMARDKWDAGLLGELAQTMQDASICGLGQAAPNPLLSVLKFFPHELEEKP